MKKFLKKINLPIILFIIIFINYLPLIVRNGVSKESYGVPTYMMALCFMLEIFIMLYYFFVQFKKIKKEFFKDSEISLVSLIILSIILLGVQVFSSINGKLNIMDIVNIICIFINILLFFILMLNQKCNENSIYQFFKAIFYMTLCACVVDLVLYYKEIILLLTTGKYNPLIMLKSFFANRNQFAFFLYLGIISGVILVKRENKIFYKLSILIFIFFLFVTMSRTGILMGAILLVLLFLLNENMSAKNKIIISISAMLIGIIGLLLLMNFVPSIWNKISSNFVRVHEIKNLSGRTEIWQNGINILLESPINFLLGVGRFKSTSILHIGSKVFTQFHNIYLDMILTSGLVGIVYYGFIYYTVIKKVLKSDMDKKYKRIYIAMFITYGIYIMFESFGRFSIGSSDTICLIFFITIPLLHANSTNNKQKVEGEK